MGVDGQSRNDSGEDFARRAKELRESALLNSVLRSQARQLKQLREHLHSSFLAPC